MHHGQELLTRMRSIRSRKAYYEQLARVNCESDEERTLQACRGDLERTRLDTSINRVPRHDGKTQSV
jgi:hypothetical protein